MSLTVNQKIKLRVSFQIISVGVLLGIIYVSFSNGFSNMYPFVNGAVIGLLLGLLISFLELWVFTKGSRKMRFISQLSLRTIIYIILIISVILVVTIVSRSFRLDMSFTQVIHSDDFKAYIIDGNFSVAIFYALLFAFSINFTRMISRKMGQGMLVSFITGTFYQPVVQERIILFIGIKNVSHFSKTLSEYDFFNFLNDYLFDITTPIVQHQGIIYEYVEDQVVVTWRPEKGTYRANCIRAYYALIDKLESRKEFYFNKYNIIPQTIASLHFGKLVRAEIGKIKTQIVFQGDAMNTAARMLGKCKDLDQQLVISDALLNRITIPVLFDVKPMGSFKLKGKADEISIYSIEDKKLTEI